MMVVSVLTFALTKLVSLVKREDFTVKYDKLEGFYNPYEGYLT